jgi:hypothetical protein
MKQMKTHILNLKKLKIQVSIRYLTIYSKNNLYRKVKKFCIVVNFFYFNSNKKLLM